MQFSPEDHPHRRLNLLTNKYVLISPHRSKRPWQGAVEESVVDFGPNYDEKCYLCPGNVRASGVRNPEYSSTFSFVNDFSALTSEAPSLATSTEPKSELLRVEPVQGLCKVLCFTPRHNVTLACMEISEIEAVIQTWIEEYETIMSLPHINYVQIFENKGQMMGCSNPHPHGQIWASSFIPEEPTHECFSFNRYAENHGGACLLCEYLREEISAQCRLVAENGDWVALVPFWAFWPFELLVLPRKHCARMSELSAHERHSFAHILRAVAAKYDNLFHCSFPYSMGIHQAPRPEALATLLRTRLPGEGGLHERREEEGEERRGEEDGGAKRCSGHCHEGHLHLHFYPPLLRSATVRKFMVGYELLAEQQRDLTPEQAAARLRTLSSVHFASPTPPHTSS
eukprot:GCRY01005250.1.p1 GENE.GCRY01005250.1~~GCRY01005250.1.p1  ORF type:complete len:398 (+),score=55.98 GCRY01005250.1:120-1313(+)